MSFHEYGDNAVFPTQSDHAGPSDDRYYYNQRGTQRGAINKMYNLPSTTPQHTQKPRSKNRAKELAASIDADR